MPDSPTHAEKTLHRHLLEVEQLIIHANRKAIHGRLKRVTKHQLESLSSRVAKIRAEYLAAAFETDWETEDFDAPRIRRLRALYEEAVAVFDALERAIERGYLDIVD